MFTFAPLQRVEGVFRMVKRVHSTLEQRKYYKSTFKPSINSSLESDVVNFVAFSLVLLLSFIHSDEGRRNSVNRSRAQVEKQQQLAGLQNIFPVEVEWENLLFSFSSSSLAPLPFNRMKSSSSREYLRSENIKIWEWMVEGKMRKWKMSMRSNLNYFSSSSLSMKYKNVAQINSMNVQKSRHCHRLTSEHELCLLCDHSSVLSRRTH